MGQNLVIPGKDNKVVFVFGGIDLTTSTNIIMNFGSEIYSTTGATPKLTATSATELSCDLSGTALTGKIFATITYFDSGSTAGTDITSMSLGNSEKIVIAIGTQLIIEDGSIVDNANSFANDEEFKTYANLRNFAVPATQPDREALLILAMDYLGSKEQRMQGCRVSIDQELSFPRRGVCAKCFNVPSTAIPKDIKKAQMELALQASTSELLVNASIQNVQREKLGDLEVEYFNGGSFTQVETGRADAFLNEYFINAGNQNIMERV